MLPLERRQDILRIIGIEKVVRVNELATRYGVAEETIRRDLERLDKDNLVKKTYGGAVLIEADSEEPTYKERERVNIEGKRDIAHCAMGFIKEGDTLMVDSSTTAIEVMKQLKNKNVTVITNSVNVALELSEYEEMRIISTGGILDPKSMSYQGPAAKKSLENYYADKAIISCKSLDKERGIMESKELEAEIKQVMMLNAKEVILVVDKTKFDRSSMIKIGDFSEINILITNYPIDDAWFEVLDKQQVQIAVV